VYQGTIITQRKDIKNTVRTTDKPKTRVVYVASDKGHKTAQNWSRQPSKSNNPIKNSKTVIISEKTHNITSYKTNTKRRTSHESNKDNKV
jgi:DNA-binding PadR family transcriptional regulator